MALHLQIALQPRQRELHQAVFNSPYTIIGYGGSAGGAKSHGIGDLALTAATRFRYINILIFRRLYDDLYQNHILPLFKRYPHLRDYFNKSESILYLPTGSNIFYGHAQREDDIYNFGGKEYDIIFIDEAADLTQLMIEFLMTRNRVSSDYNSENPDLTAKTVMTMNPRGKGKRYLRRILIEKQYEGDEDPKDYLFIPSRVYDNVVWSKKALAQKGIPVSTYYNKWNDEQRKKFCYANADYARKLMKSNPVLRAALLDGDWYMTEGQFYDNFREHIHGVESFDIPKDWKVMGAMDYGSKTISHIGAMPPDKSCVYIIYEWKRYNEIGKKYSKSEKALQYKQWLKSIGYEHIKVKGDNNMWGTSAEMPEANTPAEEFINQGIKLEPVKKEKKDGKNFLIWSNEMVYDLLDWEEKDGLMIKRPKVFIFKDRCPELMSTLPDLETDPDEPELIDQEQDIDHPHDSMKYLLINMNIPIIKTKAERNWNDEISKAIANRTAI